MAATPSLRLRRTPAAGVFGDQYDFTRTPWGEVWVAVRNGPAAHAKSRTRLATLWVTVRPVPPGRVHVLPVAGTLRADGWSRRTRKSLARV